MAKPFSQKEEETRKDNCPQDDELISVEVGAAVELLIVKEHTNKLKINLDDKTRKEYYLTQSKICTMVDNGIK